MSESEPIRVLLVDDHAVVRSGLSAFLLAFDDLELVGEASSGEEAVRLCPQVKPDVVLIDEKNNCSFAKVETDVDNPAKVFPRAFELLSKARGVTVNQLLELVGLIVHGTTQALNSLIQLRIAKTGLICTHGFRDILELREGRIGSHDYFHPLPPILVPPIFAKLVM